MAIEDIFKIQQSYNLHNKFNDQTNWQDAFKMANSFAETAEKHRANRENLATSDWRSAYQNNLYQQGIAQQRLQTAELQRLYDKNKRLDPSDIQSTIAENHFNTANYGDKSQQVAGTAELARFYANNAYDNTGRLRSPEELLNLAYSGGVASPYAKAKLVEQAQGYFPDIAQRLAKINPQAASAFAYQGGLPFLINDQGQLTAAATGEVMSDTLTPEQITKLFSGNARPKRSADYHLFAQKQAFAELANLTNPNNQIFGMSMTNDQFNQYAHGFIQRYQGIIPDEQLRNMVLSVYTQMGYPPPAANPQPPTR